MKIVRGYVTVNRKGEWVTRVFGPYTASLEQAVKLANSWPDDAPYEAIEVNMVDENAH